ncbi:MAG: hypothetical protein ACUZ8H_15795 [Candidatus Anammoxibacter sp.]
MKIKFYYYDDNNFCVESDYKADSIFEAINILQDKDTHCDYFEITEGDSFIEFTLSDKNELILNGLNL